MLKKGFSNYPETLRRLHNIWMRGACNKFYKKSFGAERERSLSARPTTQ